MVGRVSALTALVSLGLPLGGRRAPAPRVRPLPMSATEDVEDLYAAHSFTDEEASHLRQAWLSWYDAGHREMPWRREHGSEGCTGERDRAQWAYEVWVSEVMLQQTQVDRVVDYFKRWMTSFPTVEALASASLEDVRQVWTGLGYYRRARFLHEGAQDLLAAGGQLPTTAEGWIKVKGVGRYTAAAIASIVYGEAVPVVDGNVIRVLARLRAVSADPKATETNKLWWRLAADVLDRRRPGEFNQAMMELGATVCTKAAPRCETCPLSGACRAFHSTCACLRRPAHRAGWRRADETLHLAAPSPRGPEMLPPSRRTPLPSPRRQRERWNSPRTFSSACQGMRPLHPGARGHGCGLKEGSLPSSGAARGPRPAKPPGFSRASGSCPRWRAPARSMQSSRVWASVLAR